MYLHIYFRFPAYGDIDVYVSFEKLFEDVYFGRFEVCDLKHEHYDRVVQIIFI